MDESRKKSKTSSEVKRRYNQKAYGVVTAYIPKVTADAFKAKCTADGISQAQVIKKAIEEFLNT